MPKDKLVGWERGMCARHEAAHVVLAYVFRRRVWMATVRGRGDVGGWTKRSRWTYDLARPDEVEEEILIDLAGGAAEGLGTNRRVWVTSRDDLVLASEAAKVLKPRGDWRREYYDRAQGLLRPRWPYIQAIARELYEKTWLRERELLTLLDGCERRAC